MAKQIQLQVPQPCHEDWNNMQQHGNGRFCNSCQKTVIDFSLMSDEQLVDFFSKKTTPTCGRFYEDQLNREIIVKGKRSNWLLYFFQITLPLFLLSLKSSAQQRLQKFDIEVSPTQKKSADPKTIDTIPVIKGTVKDEQGIPIGFASIVIPGTDRGVTADAAGDFSIKLRSNERFIKVSSVGYEAQTITINSSSGNITAVLKNILKGKVFFAGAVTSGVVVRSTKKTKKKKEALPNVIQLPNSINIYPNPLPASAVLNLEWKYPVEEVQVVEIYTLSGELVQKKFINIRTKILKTSLTLKLKNTGDYVLRVSGTKTHKTFTSQLLVN